MVLPLLSSTNVEQRPLVPVGEENNLLNNTLWDLFFSNELKLLVLPSPLGFLSPGNGGTEGGVKTIEGRGEATLRIGASAHYFLRLDMRYTRQRRGILFE